MYGQKTIQNTSPLVITKHSKMEALSSRAINVRKWNIEDTCKMKDSKVLHTKFRIAILRSCIKRHGLIFGGGAYFLESM